LHSMPSLAAQLLADRRSAHTRYFTQCCRRKPVCAYLLNGTSKDPYRSR